MPGTIISALSVTTDYLATKSIPATRTIGVDNERWPVSAVGGMSYRTTTATTMLTASDRASLIHYTSGNVALTLTAATGLGAGWWCHVINTTTGTDGQTLTVAGAETINGATSIVAGPGSDFKIICTGSVFRTVGTLAFCSHNTTTATNWALVNLTQAHGLGTVPRRIDAVMESLATDFGHVVGEEVTVAYADSSAVQRGFSLYSDGTNMNFRSGANGIVLMATTGTVTGITATNWMVKLRAFA